MPIIVSGQTSSSICISNIDKRHSSSNCCIVTSENRLKILLLKYHTSSCLWKMLAAGGEHVVSSASTQQNLLVHWMQWSSRTVSCQHVLPLTAEVIDVTQIQAFAEACGFHCLWDFIFLFPCLNSSDSLLSGKEVSLCLYPLFAWIIGIFLWVKMVYFLLFRTCISLSFTWQLALDNTFHELLY